MWPSATELPPPQVPCPLIACGEAEALKCCTLPLGVFHKSRKLVLLLLEEAGKTLHEPRVRLGRSQNASVDSMPRKLRGRVVQCTSTVFQRGQQSDWILRLDPLCRTLSILGSCYGTHMLHPVVQKRMPCAHHCPRGGHSNGKKCPNGSFLTLEINSIFLGSSRGVGQIPPNFHEIPAHMCIAGLTQLKNTHVENAGHSRATVLPPVSRGTLQVVVVGA